MKLLIYSIEDGVPKDVLLKKPIFIKVNQDSSDDLEIDLGNEFIEFNSEGLFISFSKIESSNKAYNYLPLLRFTKKESKTVNSASFFRTIFGENKWKSIDKANLKGGIKKEYNLALKLEILEYK